MKQTLAIKELQKLDLLGKYVYRKVDLELAFQESGQTLDSTITRLVKSGILERPAHGVYVYTLSTHSGSHTLELIARQLRRGEMVYESLESALSQWGVISQIPIDRITLMTSGKSGVYQTRFGVIEFVHTKVNPNEIVDHLIQREKHQVPIADKHLAYRNLKSVGRNLDLVDKGELHGED